MQERNLGKSGLKVSAVGLGCNNFGWRIDLESSRKVIDTAIEAGITLFDTADMYGAGQSETMLGQVLGGRRKDIVLATKFGLPMDEAGKLKGASRRYVMSAVDASLSRLQTDWIDLYQLHKPDPDTPMEETLRALDDLVRAGKIRYFGISNHPAWKVVEAQWTAKFLGLPGFVSSQDEFSLLVRDAESELIPALEAYGLGLLPYFPLASGLLTGKYQRGQKAPEGSRFAAWTNMSSKYGTEANFKLVDQLTALAQEHGHSLLDLAFAWLLAKPVVSSVIAGATKPEQIQSNVEAGNWTLTPDEAKQVSELHA